MEQQSGRRQMGKKYFTVAYVIRGSMEGLGYR